MDAVEYTVKKGDSLSRIAVKYNRPASDWKKIWALNPDIKNPNLIFPNQIIKVPLNWDNGGGALTPPPSLTKAGFSGIVFWGIVGAAAYLMFKKGFK